MRADAGFHNYYLYRPHPAGPWHTINYDGDQGWGIPIGGERPRIWPRSDPNSLGAGCNCGTVSTWAPSSFYDGRFPLSIGGMYTADNRTLTNFFPMVPTAALAVLLLFLSCCLECEHWPAYLKAAAPAPPVVMPLAPQHATANPLSVGAPPVTVVQPMQPQMQMMAIECPPDSGPGQQISVNANGLQLSVVVPEGVQPGNHFQVRSPQYFVLS